MVIRLFNNNRLIFQKQKASYTMYSWLFAFVAELNCLRDCLSMLPHCFLRGGKHRGIIEEA